MGGLNVAIFVVWKISSVKRCLYPFPNGVSSFDIRTLSTGFKYGYLTSVLDCCTISETNCITCFAETFLGANRVTRLIRKLIVLMEDCIRLCSDKIICSPNVGRYCQGGIAFCTLQRPISLHCFVCGRSVNAFHSPELFEGIKLRNPLNSIHSSDHIFNGLVLVTMRTKVSLISFSPLVCIGWTREF